MLTQLLIAAGLLAMAALGPHGAGGPAAGGAGATGGAVGEVGVVGAMALLVAIASATQDIALDAWRIEAADTTAELSLLTSAFQLGYRAALLVTDALILVFAQHLGWPLSYGLMALLMGVGLGAALLTPEPARAARVRRQQAEEAPLSTRRGLFDAIAGPLVEFCRAHGALAAWPWWRTCRAWSRSATPPPNTPC